MTRFCKQNNWNLLKGDALFFAVAHESMHAAQFCNGQGGATIFNEIEAYAFEIYMYYNLINHDIIKNAVVGGRENIHGRLYDKFIYPLGKEYEVVTLIGALLTFYKGSNANNTGIL